MATNPENVLDEIKEKLKAARNLKVKVSSTRNKEFKKITTNSMNKELYSTD